MDKAFEGEPEPGTLDHGEGSHPTQPSSITDSLAMEVMDDKRIGLSYDALVQKHAIGLPAIQRILATPGKDVEILKKSMIESKFKLSAIADSILTERILLKPDKMSTGELVIASGVMTQRALDLDKTVNHHEDVGWGALPSLASLGGEAMPIEKPLGDDEVEVD